MLGILLERYPLNFLVAPGLLYEGGLVWGIQRLGCGMKGCHIGLAFRVRVQEFGWVWGVVIEAVMQTLNPKPKALNRRRASMKFVSWAFTVTLSTKAVRSLGQTFVAIVLGFRVSVLGCIREVLKIRCSFPCLGVTIIRVMVHWNGCPLSTDPPPLHDFFASCVGTFLG